ncbi:hypothetical protein MWU75_00200 [Ornithinimicrobium sp. F0845]|uniref:hypothetical protein n=1 Tax=Ornithinimicrobium sp. F0845 TaxID=2926412 RepID=UPI001FF126AC|nr:hypothetical protein [Ornithinimicrobium sp. F0845]MCK0110567.1 hypothetical protein [Ornithinimicrobium sp. F0845]
MTTGTSAYRLGLLVTVGTAALLVLGAGALGIVGSGGRADLLYGAVLAVLVLGALLARFRARGMAVTLVAAAVATVAVTVGVLVAVVPGRDDVSVLDLVGLTMMYAGLFGLAAWLFGRATARPAVAPAHS